ncbi:MAG: hypothetical protein WB239_10165, partial [Acidimicrobiia bacterium]
SAHAPWAGISVRISSVTSAGWSAIVRGPLAGPDCSGGLGLSVSPMVGWKWSSGQMPSSGWELSVMRHGVRIGSRVV